MAIWQVLQNVRQFVRLRIFDYQIMISDTNFPKLAQSDVTWRNDPYTYKKIVQNRDCLKKKNKPDDQNPLF